MITGSFGFIGFNIDYVEDRAAHDVCYWLDATKIQNELKWIDNRKFEDTLNRTIEWYKKEYN